MLARPHYAAAHEIGFDSVAGDRFIMAVIGYDAPRPAALAASCPFVRVDLAAVYPGPCYEVWTSIQPVSWHHAPGQGWAVSGDLLFGVIDTGPDDGPGIEDLARMAYERLFALADGTGRRHVVRVFNYVPRITDMEGGVERYRLFNAGRHEAFMSCRRLIEAAPAACALGTNGAAPALFFLAARQPGQAIENPRQVSAYRYPAQYGSRSPSFSRAMLCRDDRFAQLLISGTASIVGHESRHEGDVVAQTDETLRNLAAILAERCDLILPQLPCLNMKVYVRRREDVAAVRARLAWLPDTAQAMYLQAEICRPDLLVEIEASCLFAVGHLRL